MKIKLLFLGKLLAISIVLFAFLGWLEIGYQFILLLFLSLFLPANQTVVSLDYDSLIRIIPFLALMLSTPKIPWAKRIAVIAIGIAIFIAIDVTSLLVWKSFPTGQSSAAHLIFSHIWKTTGQWILPFLLWFIAVYKDIGKLFVPEQEK